MAISANQNYTLTGSQIEDLVSKVPVITITPSDPGEGVDLEANHFIAVYQA